MTIEAIRTELSALARQGRLTPANVVERAQDPTNVLHDHFEWDDSAAAATYRLMQAGNLIRTVKIKTRIGEVRAYHPVRTKADRPMTYQPAEKVLTNRSMSDQIRARMSAEVHAMVKRWVLHSAYFSFDDIIEELRSVWAEEMAA